MEMQKVVFMNKELDLRLAGLLYLPTDLMTILLIARKSSSPLSKQQWAKK